MQPFVHKLLDGSNVNIVVLGSTESGKELLLEGDESSARDSGEPGIMHLLLAAVFRELHSSSIKVSCIMQSIFAVCCTALCFPLLRKATGGQQGLPQGQCERQHWQQACCQ